MNFLSWVVDVFLHLDKHLGAVIAQYGTLTYILLFLVIFCETGLVVAPFLPGDSLIFAASTFAAVGSLDIWLLWGLVLFAAIAGDALNYWIGHAIGPRVFRHENHPIFKREYLERTQRFYEKHGPKTVVLARFIPVIRTFAPFVAGVGGMSYPRFATYNILGGTIWVTLFAFGGYYFGNIPVVRDHFSLAIMGILAISFVPAIWHLLGKLRARFSGAGGPRPESGPTAPSS